MCALFLFPFLNTYLLANKTIKSIANERQNGQRIKMRTILFAHNNKLCVAFDYIIRWWMIKIVSFGHKKKMQLYFEIEFFFVVMKHYKLYACSTSKWDMEREREREEVMCEKKLINLSNKNNVTFNSIYYMCWLGTKAFHSQHTYREKKNHCRL